MSRTIWSLAVLFAMLGCTVKSDIPHGKITSISDTDENAIQLRFFASVHGLLWKVVPDVVDGTRYCAILESQQWTQEPLSDEYEIACSYSLEEAVSSVQKQWVDRPNRPPELKIGNAP